MQKYVGKVKFLIVLAIVGTFVWFLVISPMITFHNNEKKLEEAAKRYFELNQNELPTGQRETCRLAGSRQLPHLAQSHHRRRNNGDLCPATLPRDRHSEAGRQGCHLGLPYPQRPRCSFSVHAGESRHDGS